MIPRNYPISFVVIEPESVAHKHATKKKKRKPYRRKQQANRRGRRQYHGFLNHYDFAYAGRDTGGKESEPVLPKTLRGAIEDVYQIPLECSAI